MPAKLIVSAEPRSLEVRSELPIEILPCGTEALLLEMVRAGSGQNIEVVVVNHQGQSASVELCKATYSLEHIPQIARRFVLDVEITKLDGASKELASSEVPLQPSYIISYTQSSFMSGTRTLKSCSILLITR